MAMIRVMLVDDEDDALDLLEILLQQMDDVKVVGRYLNPAKALEALNTLPVDAIFLDNQMPGMTGIELARKIREFLPHTPIVFTTAYSEYAVGAFEVQSTDYLLKPIVMSRLQNTLMRIRQAATAVQPEMSASTQPSIRCLGGFSIQLPHAENKTISWRTNKEKEICAFLIHHESKPMDTALIIDSIWPEHDLKKAKAYLYTCLSYLRRSLSTYNIPMSVDKVENGFIIALGGWVADVTQFESMLHTALSIEEPDETLYDQIKGLYKGGYMAGCDYSWAQARQEAIQAKYVRVMRKFHGLFRQSGNVTLATDSLQCVLAIVPDSEQDGRELIKLHLEAGNRHEALHVYRRLEHSVHDQLGIELERETMQLYSRMVEQG